MSHLGGRRAVTSRETTCRTTRRIYAAALLCVLLVIPAMAACAGDCDVTLSTPTVDYGRLSRASMVAASSGELQLPPRMVALRLACSDSQDMTLFFRAAAADTSEFFFTAQGRFAVRMRDAVLDGEAVELGQVDPTQDALVRDGVSLPWVPGQGLVPVKHGKVLSGRVFTAQVEIEARVNDRAMTVRDATRWSIHALIEGGATGATQALLLQADVLAGSCHVDVARHISFGRIRSTDLDAAGASTRVSSNQSGQLRVICDAPTPLAFRVARDERSGTAAIPVGAVPRYAESQWFGLGKTDAGQKIGAYALHWRENASSDQGELHATRSLDGGRSWALTGGPTLAEHAGAERIGYAAAPDATTGPFPVTALGVTLDATIYIAPRHTLSLSEEVMADGLATFEIIY